MSKPWAPVHSDHPSGWHHDKFLEFVEYKQAVGEPSPHMTLAVLMSKDEDIAERIWRAGLYGAPYSVLTSEAMWTAWPWLKAMDDPGGMVAWIYENWEGFHIRTERRMVRTPKKMVACLLSYRAWMMSGEPGRLWDYQKLANAKESYDAWYDSVITVMFFGRYITIRVVEFLRRAAGAKAELYDIRSIGGESPVRCLSMFYPEHKEALLVKKDPLVADMLAADLLGKVQVALPEVGHYVMAAMLCEYREAYEDHHQYPGRTIDQELQYLNGPKGDYWKGRYDTKIWAAREVVVPHEALGEKQGWDGVRHDLSRMLRDKGEVWSDTRYKYPSMEER